MSVKLFTKVERYQIGTDTISLPARFSRIDLSKLVNETLELEKHIPFDFIINGSLLRHLAERVYEYQWNFHRKYPLD